MKLPAWLKKLTALLRPKHPTQPAREPTTEEDATEEEECEDWEEDYEYDRAYLTRWQALMARKQWELDKKRKQDYIQ